MSYVLASGGLWAPSHSSPEVIAAIVILDVVAIGLVVVGILLGGNR